MRRAQFRQSTISGPTTGYRPPVIRTGGFRLLSWSIVGVVLLASGLGGYLFGSGRFMVLSVVVTGSVNDGVNHALGQLNGKNILWLSTASLERELPNEQSSIAALHIIKGFPDTLRVNITVRQPLVRWQSGDKIFYLDQAGVIFSLDPNPDASVTDPLPLVRDPRAQPATLGRPFVTPAFVSFVTTLQTTFRDRIGIDLKGLTVSETTRELDGITGNNLTIRFDTTRLLEPQLATLASVLSTYKSAIHESIDLRVEGRAFYK